MCSDDLEVISAREIRGPKLPLRAEGFFVSEKVKFDTREQQDFSKVHTLILNGGDLSPYYRSGNGVTSDRLLADSGVMHLHLGGKGSDTLLYLLQFPMHVVYLCIDTHVHVDDCPPGKKFPNRFQEAARKQVEDAIKKADAENQRKKKTLSQDLEAALDKLRASALSRKSEDSSP